MLCVLSRDPQTPALASMRAFAPRRARRPEGDKTGLVHSLRHSPASGSPPLAGRNASPRAKIVVAEPLPAAVSKTVSGGFPPTRVRIPPPPFAGVLCDSRGALRANCKPFQSLDAPRRRPSTGDSGPVFRSSFPRRSPETGCWSREDHPHVWSTCGRGGRCTGSRSGRCVCEATRCARCGRTCVRTPCTRKRIGAVGVRDASFAEVTAPASSTFGSVAEHAADRWPRTRLDAGAGTAWSSR